MHWVKATAPDGRPVYINMSAVQSMMRHDAITLCFLGGVCQITKEEDGKQFTYHANTQVLETPDELLNLPRIEHGEAKPEPAKPSLPRAVTAPVAGARPVDHVAAKKRKAKA